MATSDRNRSDIYGPRLGQSNAVQQQLGYAEPLTSPIDADAGRAEIMQIAQRMWGWPTLNASFAWRIRTKNAAVVSRVAK